MSQKIKQIIIVAVVLIVAFFGIKMFFGSPTVTDTTLTAESAAAAQFVDGQMILDLLDKLNKVTLDDSVFANKVFVSLVSFERPIEGQVVGRPNPFLPIGVDGSGIITSNNSTSSFGIIPVKKATTTNIR